jgi:hypothetical protein
MTRLDPLDLARLAGITGGQLTSAQQFARDKITQEAHHNYRRSTVWINDHDVGPDRNGVVLASGSIGYSAGTSYCTRLFDASYSAKTGVANVNARNPRCVTVTR